MARWTETAKTAVANTKGPFWLSRLRHLPMVEHGPAASQWRLHGAALETKAPTFFVPLRRPALCAKGWLRGILSPGENFLAYSFSSPERCCRRGKVRKASKSWSFRNEHRHLRPHVYWVLTPEGSSARWRDILLTSVMKVHCFLIPNRLPAHLLAYLALVPLLFIVSHAMISVVAILVECLPAYVADIRFHSWKQ